MLRCVITVIIVAGISASLGFLEQANGQREPVVSTRFDSSTWIRTVDGWEPPSVLTVVPKEEWTPTLHPALVAGFQAGASLFALLAFPAARSVAQQRAIAAKARKTGSLAGLAPQQG